jgi:hypothetical protein
MMMKMMVRRRRAAVNRPVTPTEFGDLTEAGSRLQGHDGQASEETDPSAVNDEIRSKVYTLPCSR